VVPFVSNLRAYTVMCPACRLPPALSAMAMILALALSAAGCTSSLLDYESRAGAPQRTAGAGAGVPAVHVVEPGDTLHKIAFRYGLDHRDIARWNGMSNPDLIFAGQRLALRQPEGQRTAAAPPSASPGAAPRPAAAPLPPPPQLPPPDWQWPTEGQVVSRFGATGPNSIASGIAIGGRSGQAVRAAAPGRIVYAGGGLIGYGQLVIIMHNDTYLTAYGHNASLMVEQGQTVSRGQQIASMGLGPEREPRLHFEIRRNGNPVDPLPYLNGSAR
jgi:lipoprotein NlpD